MRRITSNPELEILPEAAKQEAEKIFSRDIDLYINIIQKSSLVLTAHSQISSET